MHQMQGSGPRAILLVVELLLCIPMSNGHLERAFSQLKIIKRERDGLAWVKTGLTILFE